MNRRFAIPILLLLSGGATLLPSLANAGSCCGGGSSTSLIVPKYASAIADLSLDLEKYNGFWNQDGIHTDDPPGSDLRQYRVNLGYSKRLASDWQAGISLPYVWNENKYSGLSSNSNGLGDTSVSLWYEAVEDKSAWKVRELSDMVPAVTVGVSALLPTGISPYDDVSSSFDVTGRGFYRLDGNLLIDKTIQPWNVSLALAYGSHFERSVNREYGRYVEPYRKRLGDRYSTALATGYRAVFGNGGDTITTTLSWAWLKEDKGTINESTDSTTGMEKQSLGVALNYANLDSDWSVRVGWNHAIAANGWGKNFPTTDIISMGVRYVFR
jgi:hypothetical protein